jgi:hypothetical protein
MKQENIELLDKIAKGLKLANERFLEKSAANNETIVISDKNGVIKHIPARELLEQRKSAQ